MKYEGGSGRADFVLRDCTSRSVVQKRLHNNVYYLSRREGVSPPEVWNVFSVMFSVSVIAAISWRGETVRA